MTNAEPVDIRGRFSRRRRRAAGADRRTLRDRERRTRDEDGGATGENCGEGDGSADLQGIVRQSEPFVRALVPRAGTGGRAGNSAENQDAVPGAGADGYSRSRTGPGGGGSVRRAAGAGVSFASNRFAQGGGRDGARGEPEERPVFVALGDGQRRGESERDGKQ